MNLNFDEFRGEHFSIDGQALQTYEECKEWIAVKYHHRSWSGLVNLANDPAIIRMFEDQALDLYSYLLGKEQIR